MPAPSSPAPVPVVAEVPAGAKPAEVPAAGRSLLADEPVVAGAPPATAAAPEAWGLKAPEKSLLTADDLTGIEKWAKDSGFSKEQAQKYVERESAGRAANAEAAKTQQDTAYKALYTTWGDDLKADKEFGGEKLPETLAAAKKALRVFASPEERAFLDSTPFGNNPILVRILARAGAKISEDSFVAGAGNPAPPKSPSQIAYGSDHAKPSSFR
jgi:hypothetical protein